METCSAKLEAPYLSVAFPDELLGSWLSRLVVLNAEPSFVSFARTIGLNNVNTKSLVADPLNGADFVRELSKLLGVKYEAILASFTTKAYWETFQPTTPEFQPSLQRRSSPRLSPPMLRVCPACIEDDLLTAGWPYFHRTHQLRSKACPYHRLVLQDSCACGRRVRSSSEPAIISLKCACGSHLVSALKREEANEVWHALAEFSHRTLYASPGDLNILHLVPYAVSRAVTQKGLSIERSLQGVLVDSYGIDGFDWLCRRPGEQGTVKEICTRKLSAARLTPSLTIAILASCRIGFNEAKQAVAEQSSLAPSARIVPKGSRGSRKTFLPKNVSEAKKLAHNFTRNSRERGNLKVKRPFVYWMLYLDARRWLYDWMHEEGRRTVARWEEPPNVQEDRAIIMSKGPRLERQAARARAYIRDLEWLKLTDSTRVHATDRVTTVLEALRLEKERHLGEVDRPIKWTVAAAAKRLRMSPKTLTALAQRDQRIRSVVPESPHDYMLRVIAWAVKECEKQRIVLTPTGVLRMGRITGRTENMKLIEYALRKRPLG